MGSLLQNTVFGRTKNAFVSTWRTSNISSGSSTITQIKLPLISSGSYNFNVDWGDGTSNKITIWNQAQTTHNYSVAGDYTIKITGICAGWQFNNTGDRLKIKAIESWGNLRLGTTQGGYFHGCSNLNLSSVTDVLNLSGTTSLFRSFYLCSALTSINRIEEWDTSSVTNMGSMFLQSNSFNANVGLWNVSNVINFDNMFNSNSGGAFTNGESSSINNWVIKNTGPVTMVSMFSQQPLFNQPLGNWNMTGVTNINGMFFNCTSFNQDLSTWERVDSTVGNITAVNATFQGCSAFNKNMNTWNVSNISDFTSMFLNCSMFNNGLEVGVAGTMTWTIKNTGVVNMNQIFQGCSNFNQIVTYWDMSRISTMVRMFAQCSRFNNGLASGVSGNGMSIWNTSLCGNMIGVFQSAQNFNQNIGGWNVSNVTLMAQMFSGATAFNQNIGGWNVSNVTAFTSFMASKSVANYSASNLDSIFNGWSALVGGVKPDVVISFGTVKHTAAGLAAKAILTASPHNWAIADGGI